MKRKSGSLVRDLVTAAPPSPRTGKQRVWNAAQWPKGFGASTKLRSDQSDVVAKLCKQLLSRCFKAPPPCLLLRVESSSQPPEQEDTSKTGETSLFMRSFKTYFYSLGAARVCARASRELVSRSSSSSCHVKRRESALRCIFSIYWRTKGEYGS